MLHSFKGRGLTNIIFILGCVLFLQRECLSFFAVPHRAQVQLQLSPQSSSESSESSSELSHTAMRRRWRRNMRLHCSVVTEEVVGSGVAEVSADYSPDSSADSSEVAAAAPVKRQRKKKDTVDIASKPPTVKNTADSAEGVVSVNLGSTGHPHSDTSKAKISAANKGKVPWNVGKKHSEETKARIAEKTKEAMLKRRLATALADGFDSLEAYEEQRRLDKIALKAEKDKTKVKGLTVEGRKRISDSLKKRWEDPEFRIKYSEVTRGNRSHSNETRARIAAAITMKWQDEEYRAKISSPPSDEVKARISATLKAKWEDPEFREKMLTRSFERTDEWRALVSDRIRAKWSDPEYRAAVAVGIRNSNKTISLSSVHRVRGVSDATRNRRQLMEQKKREKDARLALKIREKNRKDAIKSAKIEARSPKGKSIKELLGGELWFEEKLKRRKDGNPFMDDETLEKQLTEEWREEDLSGQMEETEEDEEGDMEMEDRQREEYSDEMWEEIDVDALDEGLDIIEVYDEDGELVGTYTGAEFDKLKRNK